MSHRSGRGSAPRETRKAAALPGLRAGEACRRLHAHAGVDHDAAIWERDDRVEVELGDLGQLLAEQREPQHEVDERGGVGGRRAPEPGDEPARLAAGDELVARRRPSAARSGTPPRRSARRGRRRARTRRAGRRRGPGRHRRAARRRPRRSAARRPGSRSAPPRRARRPRPRRSSATPPVSVLCAPGSAVLTTTGKPSSRSRGGRVVRRRGDALGDERERRTRRAARAPRSALEPGVVGLGQRVGDDRSRRVRGRRRRAPARRRAAGGASRRARPPGRARARPTPGT